MKSFQLKHNDYVWTLKTEKGLKIMVLQTVNLTFATDSKLDLCPTFIDIPYDDIKKCVTQAQLYIMLRFIYVER